MTSGFDKLARPYRWMEYLSFGRALERCRVHFLPQLHDRHKALLLGDGDGRFTAALLQSAPGVKAVAADGSAAMLQALCSRCASDRVTTVCADLRQGLPESAKTHVDLVATHFFLDCLTDAEVCRVADDVTACAEAGALWVVSEFHVPQRGAMRWPSWLVVRALYVSFRALTGLRVMRLPEYRAALQARGWRLLHAREHVGGLLVSELWQRDPAYVRGIE